MNYPPPLSLCHSLKAEESARHAANEVHLSTKRGGLHQTPSSAHKRVKLLMEGKFGTSARHVWQSGITHQKPHMMNLIQLTRSLHCVFRNNLQFVSVSTGKNGTRRL